MTANRRAGLAAAVLAAALLTGCSGSLRTASPAQTPAGGAIPPALLRGLRTVGRGRRFHPAVRGPVPGRCEPRLGRRIAAHVELFARNHVVLVATGIGARPPRRTVDARIVGASCFGSLVTVDPTGTVYVRRGATATLGTLFRAWGEPLTSTRLASFRAGPGDHVAVFVDGRRRRVAPRGLRLTRGAEIVLEVGPYVPPHRRYTFAPAPAAAMR